MIVRPSWLKIAWLKESPCALSPREEAIATQLLDPKRVEFELDFLRRTRRIMLIAMGSVACLGIIAVSVGLVVMVVNPNWLEHWISGMPADQPVPTLFDLITLGCMLAIMIFSAVDFFCVDRRRVAIKLIGQLYERAKAHGDASHD